MSDQPHPIQLDDVLITEKLSRRSPRQPDLSAENQAMRSLIWQLAHAPDQMLQRLVELARELCAADTAGVSLIETQPNGAEVFRWRALAGALAAQVGGCVSRHFSPCAVCLEQEAPVLFAYPERYFTALQQAHLPMPEMLVLPLVVANQPLGTLWLVAHHEQRQFDAEDVRLMMGLADFTAATLQRHQQQARALRVANTALQQESTERKLAEERSLALIENLPGGAAFVLDLDLRYLMAAGEALAIARFQPQDFVGRTIFEVLPSELAAIYEPMYRMALAGAPFEHEHQAHDRWYISRGTPLRTESGEIYGVLAVSYDITDRKQTEAALRESEEKYRGLFDSIDVGFCIIEVLFNSQEKPFDYRFLETNPAFIEQTGLTNAIGRTILELAPGHETFWFDIYGEIALTGKPARFEHQAEALPSNPWYEVYAFRIGEPEARHVAVLFIDIANRKRAEARLRRAAEMDAFRVKLSDALRSLSDPIAIQRAATQIIGEHLAVDRVFYTTMMPDGVTTAIHDNYVREGVSKFIGNVCTTDFGSIAQQLRSGKTVVLKDMATDDFTPAEKAVYARNELIAAIAVPLVKGNRWVATLVTHSKTPRQWTAAEVALVQETAERTWAAVERANAEATTTADLRDTQLLRELSARLISEENVQVFYNEIVVAAIALTQADAGTVQILDEATQDLVMLASQGFEPNFIAHFQRVRADSQTSCGLTLKKGQRACIDFDDPEREDADGCLQFHLEAGYRSAQSTPLITRWGRLIGIVSTHWCRHYRPTERELRFLDLLARQATDLIEQRRAEHERSQLLEREQAARAEAERANRVKDEFLAILSHELRSPLNPILGWSQMLQTKSFDPATVQQGLTTIERNAKLQVQLIDDLLDINRILRGKLRLETTTVNLITVIDAAMEVVSTAAQTKAIALQFNYREACQVRGDESRLQQIVWNLLANAIKFTPEGGRVDVRLEQVAGGGSEVGGVNGAGRVDEFDGGNGVGGVASTSPPSPTAVPYTYAQITITDTGQGISPDFMPYLFQSFRQEDSSTTRQYGGLGLGLAIVKYLVDAHGGRIRAASSGVGQGATFTVQLPLLEKAIALPEAPTSPPVDLTGLRVLAVDDSTDTRELLAMFLNTYGAETCVVATGAEVLANLATFAPDVLICDISMPDMDGYALLQKIRALPDAHGGNVPAIAVTAFAREEDRQRALDYGFQQHVAKPIEPKVLASAIAQLTLR